MHANMESHVSYPPTSSPNLALWDLRSHTAFWWTHLVEHEAAWHPCKQGSIHMIYVFISIQARKVPTCSCNQVSWRSERTCTSASWPVLHAPFVSCLGDKPTGHAKRTGIHKACLTLSSYCRLPCPLEASRTKIEISTASAGPSWASSPNTWWLGQPPAHWLSNLLGKRGQWLQAMIEFFTYNLQLLHSFNMQASRQRPDTWHIKNRYLCIIMHPFVQHAIYSMSNVWLMYTSPTQHSSSPYLCVYKYTNSRQHRLQDIGTIYIYIYVSLYAIFTPTHEKYIQGGMASKHVSLLYHIPIHLHINI